MAASAPQREKKPMQIIDLHGISGLAAMRGKAVARPTRFELVTPGLEDLCSIQLS